MEEGKKDLVKDVLIFSRLGIWLEDSSKGSFGVHNKCE